MADLGILIIIMGILSALSWSVIASEENTQPSPELLEFLGEWETGQGNWFNPLWILKNLSATDTTSTGEEEQSHE